MEPNKLIRLNHIMQEKLNETNRGYYDVVLTKVRFSFRDEKQSEETLYEVLTDLVMAQEQGIDGQTFFEMAPETLAQAIIENSEKMKRRELIKIVMPGFLVYIQLAITTRIFHENIQIGRVQLPFELISVGIGLSLLLYSVVKMSRKSYVKATIGIVCLLCVVFLCGFILLSQNKQDYMLLDHKTYGWVIAVMNCVLIAFTINQDKHVDLIANLCSILCVCVGVLGIIGVITQALNNRMPWLVFAFLGVYCVMYFIKSVHHLTTLIKART
ncbi:hypothetical protein AOC36_03630 [Erysipelothrix larvae]|uniref:DUF1129 domain-containing protein n=1 Tax=Erysipelothrix larvae TaxID=1514105 RepID=A0A0X8GZ46_9FIRM|nr:hypothetical protein [Erysipelothrix larvae]AMC93098.1 hypothetical protein AOC36_03630 [Erysipelothrix larvae]